ncbi:serine hydrolase domain-containing protein [Ohtaekwangia koreensis]|uniref:CubicO group peptidase, beta-lactamase class C family n=1 Tax=Ohtaekwangia koreensis TaxID=688867 RepID=A0A1T5JSC1_9BACT|nr:serine hydrolase domain-containing protein [Ohtaekwangia koreensis]SKC54215.1 CubicO group peptidase, beta-lactamase class C family [Ohtaekwangia koreensis]
MRGRHSYISSIGFIGIVILIGVFLDACSIKSSHDTAQGGAVEYDFLSVNSQIQNWIDSGYYDGASILVVKDSQVVLEKYFGKYIPETQVYIASAGKWLAAATIATLVAERRLSWNDSVAKWLPEFKDIKGKATVRQLLSHTSGYPDYQPEGNHRDDYQSLEEAVKHIANLPADTMPGTKFQYGGLAMQVVGRIAEVATGKKWEDLFQEKIAIPLNMTNTHFTPVDSTDGHNPMIGGGARSTLHDYIHFLEMIAGNGIYKGKYILSPESIEAMQADQVKEAIVPVGEYVEKARASKHTGIYGLGEWREILNDEGDAVLISSPSWAGAYPWIDKEYGIYGFFIAHVNVGKANRDKFSSFYASPLLPILVRNAIDSTEPSNLSSKGVVKKKY